MTTGLLTMTDDLLIHIASMLTAPTDLVRLQLTCPRFADKVCGSSEMLSIPEEAARLWLEGCSEQERGWVPRRGVESWLGLMHEVGVLRLPLAFGRAHADITLSENGAVATMGAQDRHRPGRGEQGGDAVGASLRAVHGGGGQACSSA